MEDDVIDSFSAALAQVAAAFHYVLEENGVSAAGVGWAGEEGQTARFAILARDFATDQPLVVNDIGCGYGALFGYLDQRFPNLAGYVGTDVCEDMIEAAKARIGDPRAAFIQNAMPLSPAHWCVASGTFNISVGADEAVWLGLTREVLRRMAGFSLRGFAFNMLRPHCRDEFIWGSEPEPWETFCRDALGGRVERIDHDGGDEWSLIVRRV